MEAVFEKLREWFVVPVLIAVGALFLDCLREPERKSTSTGYVSEEERARSRQPPGMPIGSMGPAP